jgi:hypothetical protein
MNDYRRIIEQPKPERTVICLVGKAGAGKDSLASVFYRKYGVDRIALADPIKSFAAKMYGFTSEQLWGPSAARNEVSSRWNLSARRVLQVLGTEIGRQIHPETWLRFCWEQATVMILQPGCVGACVTDVRFKNEVEFFRTRGAKIIKIVRPELEALKGDAGNHPSELEMVDVPDSSFDDVVVNEGSLEDLEAKACQVAEGILGLRLVED